MAISPILKLGSRLCITCMKTPYYLLHFWVQSWYGLFRVSFSILFWFLLVFFGFSGFSCNGVAEIFARKPCVWVPSFPLYSLWWLISGYCGLFWVLAWPITWLLALALVEGRYGPLSLFLFVLIYCFPSRELVRWWWFFSSLCVVFP